MRSNKEIKAAKQIEAIIKSARDAEGKRAEDVDRIFQAMCLWLDRLLKQLRIARESASQPVQLSFGFNGAA